MAVKIMRRWFWGQYSLIGATIATVVFVMDQAHKYYIVEVFKLPEKGRVPVLPFLDYVMAWNKGVSYGLFAQTSFVGTTLLILFALFASLGFVTFMAHSETKLTAISTGLIIGGALGNAVDRMHWPGVADYFSLHFMGHQWYIFNIADVAIVAGVLGILWDTLAPKRKNASKEP